MVSAQLTPIGVGIHNVLIATDFSRYSNVALNFGLELAHDYHATAYVAAVIPTDEILIAGPDAYLAAKDATRRDLLELKAEVARVHSFVEGKDYHLYMLEGAVAEALLDFAHSKQIDLIVVATHGRSGLGKVLIGSVAEKVFRQSSVPVLTIGPRVHRPAYKNPRRKHSGSYRLHSGFRARCALRCRAGPRAQGRTDRTARVEPGSGQGRCRSR